MEEPARKIGPYELVSRLGQGTFGVVWLAEKRASYSTTRVALKLPREDIDLEAFRHEAAIWVQASGHTNVLPLIEAEVYGEQVVIVSEYAPDGSLESWRARHGGSAPSVEAACEMMEGVLEGLAHLHERSIIHRDLKPDNILLQGRTPRLADFGISRLLQSRSHVTKNITGTFEYMAPEAFDGKRDEQTDIWAAGVIFYEMLAGRLPYDQQDATSLIGAIVRHDPPPLPAGRVPEAVQRVVARAMERDRARRYTSAREMLKDVHEAGLQLWLARREASQRVPATRVAGDPKVVIPETRVSGDRGSAGATDVTYGQNKPDSYRPPIQNAPSILFPADPVPPERSKSKRRWALAVGGLAALVVTLWLLVFYVTRPSTLTPEEAGRMGVAATVNDRHITLREVDTIISLQSAGEQSTWTPAQLATARLKVLDDRIQREALVLRAEKEKLTPTSGEIDEAVNVYRRQMTAEAWQKYLSESNLTEELVREEARKDLAIKKLQDKTTGYIMIRDQELVDFFNNNKPKFFRNRGVGLYVISADPASNANVTSDAVGDAAAQAKIDRLYQTLLTGVDFATLARAQSEDTDSAARGGDIGYFDEAKLRQSSFPESLISLLFGSMRLGDVTQPVKDNSGRWHVFKLIDRRLQNERLELDSPGVRDEIKKYLLDERMLLANSELAEQAKSEATIVNYLRPSVQNYLLPER